MIKKIIMVAMFLGVWATMAQAESFQVPQAQQDQAHTSDYIGVSFSTITFSTNTVLMYRGQGSLLGFVASSNTAISDFISFYDTGAVLPVTADEQPGLEFARVYLSTSGPASTTVMTGIPYLGTTYKFPASLRTKRGLVARCSVGTLNLVTVIFTKFNE